MTSKVFAGHSFFDDFTGAKFLQLFIPCRLSATPKGVLERGLGTIEVNKIETTYEFLCRAA